MAKKANVKANAEVNKICKSQGVDKVYCNSRGEYFTNLSYAVSSEGGDKKKVTTCYAAEEEAEQPDEKKEAIKKVADKVVCEMAKTLSEEAEKKEGDQPENIENHEQD